MSLLLRMSINIKECSSARFSPSLSLLGNCWGLYDYERTLKVGLLVLQVVSSFSFYLVHATLYWATFTILLEFLIT